MRQIKFRAWESEFHKEHPNPVPKMINWNNLKTWQANSWFQSRLILMQFTGSTDEDGTKIYEGDILKNLITGQIGVVVYDNDKCCFNVTDEYPDVLYNCQLINVPGDGWMQHEIKVVGNVYENKELCDQNE